MKRVSNFLFGAALVAILNAIAGTRGLYLFDEAIFYQYGWLIRKGLVPFIDFQTPVPPGAGLVMALGYALFGVSHAAGVYIVSLIAAAGYVLAGLLLESLVGVAFANLGAFAIVGLSLLTFQVPAYNQLTGLTAALIGLILLRRARRGADPFAPEATAPTLGLWALITFAAYLKFHVGVLLALLTLALEARHYPALLKQSPRRIGRVVVARFGLPAAGLLALLVWVGFDVKTVVYNLFGVAKPYPFSLHRPSLNYLIDWPVDIFSQPQLTLGAAVVLALVVMRFTRAWTKSPQREMGLVAIGLTFVQAFVAINSGEVPVWNLPVAVVVIAAVDQMLELELKGAFEKKLVRGLVLGVWWGVFAWFAVPYALDSMRKTWSEPRYAFDHSVSTQLDQGVKTSIPYFEGVRVTPAQRANLELVYAFLNGNRDKTMYFGPELEMFYAVFDKVPPRTWPLWSHPYVTYADKDLPRLMKAFLEVNPDVIAIGTSRSMLVNFLIEHVKANYINVTPPQANGLWLQIFVRNDPALVSRMAGLQTQAPTAPAKPAPQK